MNKQTILTDQLRVEVSTDIKITPRILDFADILDATTIEYDEDSYDPPWEDCDGLEHEFQRVYYLDHDDNRDSYQYVSADGKRGFIVIDPRDVEKKWGFDENYRQGLGMAKQPFREMVQRNIRRTTEQLVDWYENGWQYFGVVCRIKITENGIEQCDYQQADYIDSVWRFPNEQSAEEAKQDIALSVAAQLEKDGYIVENQPSYVGYTKLQAMRDKIQRQLDLSM